MRLASNPVFERLQGAQSILVAGAGGGSDILAGLPLCFALEAQGKTVHLANLTFADLSYAHERPLHEAIVAVDADAGGREDYFPEKYLSRWYATCGEARTVYCFEKTGVVPLSEAYRRLCAHLEVDALVLVDGGTDILMRGDEAGLGTPVEDMTSLSAARAAPVSNKLVLCLGFGIDTHHGVCHAHFLDNVAALQQHGGYLGALSVLPQMPEGKRYLEAIAWINEAAPRLPSIVNASIASAVQGHYGNVHATTRTAGSELWINPLMSQYFAFDLDAVASRGLYLEALAGTHTIHDVVAVIEAYRARRSAKPWKTIPV